MSFKQGIHEKRKSMKNIILDTPFESDALVRMSQNETIIWTGSPSRSLSIFDIGLDFSFILAFVKRGVFVGWFILAFLIYYNYFGMNYISTVAWSMIGIVAILAPEFFMMKRKKSTQYILTSEQLIFHLWWWGKKSTHSIPLSNIANVLISEKSFNDTGVILVMVKNANQLTFNTRDFASNETRHQPTLEMIKDIHTVTGIFQKAIREHRKK